MDHVAIAVLRSHAAEAVSEWAWQVADRVSLQSMIAGKAWGSTSQLLANSAVEAHRVSIRKGGKCSEHCHQSKWNAFLVLSGRLKVKVWKSAYPLTDETILEAGQIMQVAPGEFHQFEALADTDALELYWAALDSGDIVRRRAGS